MRAMPVGIVLPRVIEGESREIDGKRRRKTLADERILSRSENEKTSVGPFLVLLSEFVRYDGIINR